MEKPDVDQIDGLSPAISIDQKGASRNPRSTVGTVTEIYDHLRLLFARIGHPHCPTCGREIERQTVQQIVDQVYRLPEGTRLLVLGPLIKDRKTEGDRIFEAARKQGFVRVRVDGARCDLAEAPTLDKYKRHTIEVVVDRFVVRAPEAPGEPPPDAARLADSIETALRLGEGVVRRRAGAARRRGARRSRSAATASATAARTTARRSTSSSRGASPSTRRTAPARPAPGLGTQLEIDPDLVIPDRGKSLAGGRARPVGPDADRRVVAAEDPRGDLRRATAGTSGRPSATCRRRPSSYVLHSAKDGEGPRPLPPRARREHVQGHLRGRSSRTSSGATARPSRSTSRPSSRSTWSAGPARPAAGKRLRPEVLAVTIDGRNIWDVSTLSITDALRWVDRAAGPPDRARADDRPPGAQGDRRPARLPRRRRARLPDARPDQRARCRAARPSGSASRPRSGRSLMGVLYILDEPSIGLHQRDNAKLIATLTRLRDLGNTRPRRRARRGDDPDGRLGRRHRARGGRARRRDHRQRARSRRSSPSRGRSPARSCAASATVPIPERRRAGQRHGARRPRRPGAQPARASTSRFPLGHVRRGHRRVGLGQEHARDGGPLPGPGPRAERRRASARRARRARGRRARRQDHRDRPEPDRPDAALQPGHLHRPVHADPRAVRRRPRGARPRLRPRPLQLQRQGRPLRELQGRRDPQDRDAVPARRLRPLRGLQGQALQPRGARDPLQGQARSPTCSR